MRIVTDTLLFEDLEKMAAEGFGDLVKGVVDIDRELLAVDAELHSDLEALLLQDGSQQKNLWGIDLYPELPGDAWIEFDTMINVRPSQNNPSRGVESEATRRKIVQIVNRRIAR
jgi:Protein of unknown function (DUF5674)